MSKLSKLQVLLRIHSEEVLKIDAESLSSRFSLLRGGLSDDTEPVGDDRNSNCHNTGCSSGTNMTCINNLCQPGDYMSNLSCINGECTNPACAA